MVELWLDDERNPEDQFIQEEFGSRAGMLWVKTAWAAISRLKDGNVSFISLDHDLGHGKAGSGADVARWIEEKAYSGELPRLAWAIHSKNVVGSKNIRAAMNNAERYWSKNEQA
jgi:hypothetical protein